MSYFKVQTWELYVNDIKDKKKVLKIIYIKCIARIQSYRRQRGREWSILNGPLPPAISGHSELCLKQKISEMDDFERKLNFGCKGKTQTNLLSSCALQIKRMLDFTDS